MAPPRLQDITRSLDPEQTTGGVTYKICRISVERIKMTGSGFSSGLPQGGQSLPPTLSRMERASKRFALSTVSTQVYPPGSPGGSYGIAKADPCVCPD